MESRNYITACSKDLKACSTCLHLCKTKQFHCHICGSKIDSNNRHGIQTTIALLITALVLYIPSNLYPIMYTTYLGETSSNTILGGVITLWEHGSYPIAVVIFVASVLVPVVKIIALGWLSYSVHTKRILYFKNNHRMFRLTEFIGRWSMVDIFVVAILVALIQMGNVMRIMPGEASIAFAAMVVTTMLAAHYFDPRLIWEKLDQSEEPRVYE
ncbi:MAG: paraquat-inducible protein A [Kangiellaceae bacterium]|nr:paraquat-inducible protein A [Kangiellaceae bacterium]